MLRNVIYFDNVDQEKGICLAMYVNQHWWEFLGVIIDKKFKFGSQVTAKRKEALWKLRVSNIILQRLTKEKTRD